MLETTHEQRVALREHDWSSNQNVVDEFKGMSTEEIKQALLSKRNGFHIVFENALRDFNFGGIIRASNAFCCDGITYTGFRRYDTRGSVGTKHIEDVEHLADPKDFIRFIRARQQAGIPFIVAEYLTEESKYFDKQTKLSSFCWPEECTVMFGEEGTGVSENFLYHADHIIYVPQFGSVRSMNVASTTHIFMYDYMQKTGRLS